MGKVLLATLTSVMVSLQALAQSPQGKPREAGHRLPANEYALKTNSVISTAYVQVTLLISNEKGAPLVVPTLEGARRSAPTKPRCWRPRHAQQASPLEARRVDHASLPSLSHRHEAAQRNPAEKPGKGAHRGIGLARRKVDRFSWNGI